MSPVSSSTFTCASARWRNAAGSTAISGRVAGRRKVGGRHARLHLRRRAAASSPASPGIGSTSTRPGHGFTSRASSGIVLAQRVSLELRREVEVTQARVAVEHEAVHLPRFALVPVGARDTPTPTTRRAGRRREDRSSGSRANSCAASTRRARTLGSGRRSRRPVRLSPWAARAWTCRPNLLRRRGRRHPVDAGDEREVVEAELLLAHLRGCGATRRGRTRTTTSPNTAACSTIAPSRRRARPAGARARRSPFAQRSGRLRPRWPSARRRDVSQRRSAPAARRANARRGLRS